MDVNMGCPKKFSVQDGMGAALLDNEAGAASLIRALRTALPTHVPVTCKIRLLDTPEKTLAFARAMAAAGCAAVGVHMRWVSYDRFRLGKAKRGNGRGFLVMGA